MTLAPSFRLDLRQSQSLVLTPQLQQAIRLLQMSNIEVAAAIDREVAENPFLERNDRDLARERGLDAPTLAEAAVKVPANGKLDPGDDGWWQPSGGRAADCSLGLRRSATQAFDDPGTFESRLTRPRSLAEHLAQQVGGHVRDPRIRALAAILAEHLDEDGYLRELDAVLAQQLRVDESDIARARAALQACDPAGIAARDLPECLALQLKERDRHDPAMATLLANLPLLARAERAELMRRCGVDAEDLQDMIDELRRLDPRPGLTQTPQEAITVIPDIFVYPGAGGAWLVELNGGNLPRVRVDRDYHDELAREALDRRAREYMSERFQSANWLAKALDQRARTMLKVARAIFGRQRAFLDDGVQALRPLVLRDIALATGLHESTVSRATAEKYAATPHGTFPLKFFFTTALPATVGAATHSAEAIRQQIKRLIEREDPKDVLSDDQIVVELGGRGVAIARRTVAKYRESLGIASSLERRRTKALGR